MSDEGEDSDVWSRRRVDGGDGRVDGGDGRRTRRRHSSSPSPTPHRHTKRDNRKDTQDSRMDTGNTYRSNDTTPPLHHTSGMNHPQSHLILQPRPDARGRVPTYDKETPRSEEHENSMTKNSLCVCVRGSVCRQRH
eukprot:GHVR01030474.1.p1 GENE.GHVR01030474.1~~GHVR01030474.1.p1  ORF type:complete len:136 (+),score=29.11 GHVR01030474.1:125-532(+)